MANFQTYDRKGVVIHIGQCHWLHYIGQMILCGIKIWFYWGMFPQKPFQPLQVFPWIPNPPKEQTMLSMIEAKCSSSVDLPQLMLPQQRAQDQLPHPVADQKESDVERGSRQKQGEIWTAVFDRRAEMNVKMMELETLANWEQRGMREGSLQSHYQGSASYTDLQPDRDVVLVVLRIHIQLDMRPSII